MRSPALALGWELWARNRLGLLVVPALLACGAGLGYAGRAAGNPDLYETLSWAPFCSGLVAFLYLLVVFTYADIAPGGRSRGLPPHLYTLPVRTYWLVGVPMLCGTATIFVLVGAYDCFEHIAYSGTERLLIHLRYVSWQPAFFLTAFLAIVQALSWTLVRSPTLRLALFVVGLPSFYFAIRFMRLLFEINWYHGEAFDIRILSAITLCAYVVAVIGVTLDRRGDRLDWSTLGRWLSRALPALPSARGQFSSPAAAERWLELRKHLWTLPALVFVFFIVLLWSALLPFSKADVARSLVAFLYVPAVAGFFVGFGMGKGSFWARSLQFSPLAALRPVSDAALVQAKLQAAAISAILAWGAVLVLGPAWAVLSGSGSVARELLSAWFGELPGWQAGALAPVALVGAVGFTWLQMVAGMCLSLTGRIAVVNGAVLLYGLVGGALAALGAWAEFQPGSLDSVLVILWCLAGVLGLLKIGVLAAVWRRIGSQSGRTLPHLALIWLAVAICLVVSITAGLPTMPIPAPLLALYAVLALPLTRLVALPAAVAWNRHR